VIFNVKPVVSRTASQLAAEGIVTLAAVLSALPASVGVDLDVTTVLDDARDQEGRRTHALVAGALGVYQGTRPLFVSSFDPSVPLSLRNRSALTGEVGLGLIASQTPATRSTAPPARSRSLMRPDSRS
jgi:glycerophosphoryl diester phosphodiesterase